MWGRGGPGGAGLFESSSQLVEQFMKNEEEGQQPRKNVFRQVYIERDEQYGR